MPSKRKTNAPSRVLVDDMCDASTADMDQPPQQQDGGALIGLSNSPSALAVNHDFEEDSVDLQQVNERSQGILDDMIDSCQSSQAAAVEHSSPATAVNHDADENLEIEADHPLSLRVVTSSTSSLPSAPDDNDGDVTNHDVMDDDVTGHDVTPAGDVAVSGEQQGREWLSNEVASVLRKISLVVSAAGTLDERRRRVDEMLNELETIRRHLFTTAAAETTQSDAAAAIASLTSVCATFLLCGSWLTENALHEIATHEIAGQKYIV